MYLSYLNENQKELFLDLSIYVSNIDGNFSDVEKKYLSMYANEMQIDCRYEMKNVSIDNILSEMRSCSTKKHLKIIYFEILALVYCDSDYDKSEKIIVDKIAKSFNLDLKECEEIDKALKAVLSANEKSQKIIFSE